MKQAKQSKPRNFVAKHARGGGGAHQDKTGPHASRARQKHNYTRNQEV
jgi:hypothetical protein